MKKSILLIMLVILMSSVSAGINFKHIDGPKDNYVKTSVYNKGKTQRSVRANAYFPNQDVYSRYPSFKYSEKRPKRLYFDVNDMGVHEPGYYPMIVRLNNDDGFRQKEHTWVYLE